MLDIDDITHVDSVIAREFPLHNCGSWNRIKKELVVVQQSTPCQHEIAERYVCVKCGGIVTASFE